MFENKPKKPNPLKSATSVNNTTINPDFVFTKTNVRWPAYINWAGFPSISSIHLSLLLEMNFLCARPCAVRHQQGLTQALLLLGGMEN